MDELPMTPPLPSRTPQLAHLLLGVGLFCLVQSSRLAWRITTLQVTPPDALTVEYPGASLGLLLLGWTLGVLSAWLVALVEPTWHRWLRRLGLLTCLCIPLMSLVQLDRLEQHLISQPQIRVDGWSHGPWEVSGWLLVGTGLLALAWFAGRQRAPALR